MVAFLKPHSTDVVLVGFVVGEVPLERVLLREGHPRMFPNLRRTHEHGNLPLNKQLSFYFLTYLRALVELLLVPASHLS